MNNVCQKRLKLNKESLVKESTRQMRATFAKQIAREVDIDSIFTGNDEERRAKELHKVLILAGFDVDVDLADNGTVNLIEEVLQNFNKGD